MRCGRAVCRKLHSGRGQTFILVMTVTALAAVLGTIAMSTALMSLRLRSMKRLSDKNFYHLELAVEEIRAGVGVDASLTAESAVEGEWEIAYLYDIGVGDPVILTEDAAVRMSSRKEAAVLSAGAYLADFSLTIPIQGSARTVEDRTEELSVSVGDMQLTEAGAVVFKDVTFTLINYERDAQTQICCDLVVRDPADTGRGSDEGVLVENWRRIG